MTLLCSMDPRPLDDEIGCHSAKERDSFIVFTGSERGRKMAARIKRSQRPRSLKRIHW